MKRTQRHARRRGFTLVEIAISAAVMAVLLFSVGMTMLSGNQAYRMGLGQDRLASQAQRVLERVADEISMGGASNLTPVPTAPLGSATLTFRTPTGWSGSAVTWASSTRIDLQYSPQDPNDGVDNDGSGTADDGMVVLTRDVGLGSETSTVLARNVREYLEGETPNGLDDNANGLVDERGLSFALSGDRLTVRLTMVSRDGNGRDLLRTVSTNIKVRN